MSAQCSRALVFLGASLFWISCGGSTGGEGTGTGATSGGTTGAAGTGGEVGHLDDADAAVSAGARR